MTVAATTQDGGMPLRIGSLFAGYGGLDLGLHAALGNTEPAWFSEIDRAPSKVLAHHWPDVPNLGDVTAVDWGSVEPVDVLTGGFPCQDVSVAGLRRGLRPDTRSGLWAHFALAIDALRPPLVVIENVKGLLSAEAHSDLEPDPWDLGGPDGNDRPALRALGAVLGDLAELGYDARWAGVRAADAGAPHGRARIFVVARPAADPRGETERLWARLRESEPRGLGGRRPHDDRAQAPAADTDGVDGRRPSRAGAPTARPSGAAHTAADTDVVAGHGRADEPLRGSSRRGPAREHRGTATDAGGSGRDGRRPDGQSGAHDAPARRGAAAAADTRRDESQRWGGPRPVDGTPEEAPRPRNPQHDAARASSRTASDWGPYRAAVTRWERVTGRLAPEPTETGPKGAHRLNPWFVEWMMGLPAGHVTDPAIGLTRNEQLKALGNGVVPQQAALALRLLLTGEAGA